MPRDGSLTLSDVRAQTLTIICEPCGRRGRYNVERLIVVHGADAKLTELLVTLPNWRRRAHSASTTDARRCTRALASGLNLPPTMTCHRHARVMSRAPCRGRSMADLPRARRQARRHRGGDASQGAEEALGAPSG
jgi:hypothetical protein